MAKVVISGFEDAEKKAIAKIKKALNDPTLKKDVGDLVLKNMTTSLHQGKDPETRKPHETTISKKWKDQRDKIFKNGKNTPSQFYKKNRALEASGQVNKSFVVEVTKHDLKIVPRGVHMPYKNSKGRAIGKALTNSKLVGYLQEKGFRIFGAHENTIKSVKSLVNRALRKMLK